ncbi:MAG: hypothetical protein IKN95_09910 [Lachnospiraceae bacterium]|nr:hypothetical protein [Lachnospiraceae bacterium]
MNENLKAIFDSYEKEKNVIRKKLNNNKDITSKLNNDLESICAGCNSIVDRVNRRKENKLVILELEKKLANAYEIEIILKTSLRVACEMQIKTVTNALCNEIIENPEKWSKYPLHFQKFKNMIDDFLDGTGFYFYNSMGLGSYYIAGSYDYQDTQGYVLHTNAGVITQEVIEEMKRKEGYNIIPASDIIAECKKAFKARKKIIEKYEAVKKEIDSLRTPFSSCNAFYSVLPYTINLDNYNRY